MHTDTHKKNETASENANLSAIKNFFSNFKESGIVIALLIICIILSSLSPYFLSVRNIFNVLRQFSIIGILAVGQAFIIIAAGIDLSVGWVLGLSGVSAALLTLTGLNPVLVLLLSLGAGAVCGYINGILFTKLKINAFIVTLGTGYIFRGATLLLTGGSPVPFESSLTYFGSGYIGPVPISVIVMFIVVVIGQVFSLKTVTGRNVYAVGNSEKASALSGIGVESVRITAYVVMGILAAISAILLTGNMQSADPLVGSGYEMDSIAACVIGGVSLMGGEGTILGVVLGAALMGVLRNGFVLLGVSAYAQIVSIGVVIIAAVFIDTLRKR